MAFDPVSGRILLFGGTGAGSVNDARNDTWTWDGSTWLELHPATSPPPRLGASMTLDSWSGHLLLFGGQAGIGGYFDDTWEWNGSTWELLQPSGPVPPPRMGASMTGGFLPVLLFGGEGENTTFDDTWTWNGPQRKWYRLTPNGSSPVARWGAAMGTPPPELNVMFGNPQNLLFGGYTASAAISDTWYWIGTRSTWGEFNPSSVPLARYCSSMAFDSAANELVLFGGLASSSNSFFDDTWAWNASASEWEQLSPIGAPPPSRGWAAMEFDSANNCMVLFGGAAAASTLGDTWILDRVSALDVPFQFPVEFAG
jgi:hypothetical protein